MGHVAVAEHLAARGAEASSANAVGMQPLHFAASRGHLNVAEHLASRGAEPNLPDGQGLQPLHWAAHQGHAALAEHLAAAWATAEVSAAAGSGLACSMSCVRLPSSAGIVPLRSL